MNQPKSLPIGKSDFTTVIEQGYYWIDKSQLIAKIIDGVKLVLLPRPRRFGKTLNMDMLRCFFSNDAERESLFHGSWISRQADYGAHRGRYPVISLSLKGVKHPDWSSAYEHLRQLIRAAWKPHEAILTAGHPTETNAILSDTASYTLWSSSLKTLIEALAHHHQQPVVVLIDEYDTPIHQAYLQGYYEEMVGFLRTWLGEGLKDQPHLYRGVLTGIMQMTQESLFSGLNNIKAYPVHNDGVFCDQFGFTPSEVDQLLSDYNLQDKGEEVRRWYNGYHFDLATVYNPWSILNYVRNAPNPPQPYWINTSSNDLACELIQEGNNELKYELEQLLSGQLLIKSIKEAVVLRGQLFTDDVWSFLLASGYLTSCNPRRLLGKTAYELSIPNQEIHACYREIIKKWLHKTTQSRQHQQLLLAFLQEDFPRFERLLQDFVLALLSYHDLARDKPAEAVIQAFVLGLLASLTEDFRIDSNRETGLGRADIVLTPLDLTQTGFVIELKSLPAGEAIDVALEQALEQIEDKRYRDELSRSGVGRVVALAMVLQGKVIRIRTQSFPPSS